MFERLRDSVSMLGIGLRIDRRLTISLVVMTLLTNLAMTLRALWFALLVDAALDGNVSSATTWALVLAVSDALRSWALVGSQMDRQDLHDKALQFFQEEAIITAGSLPGIEHHEHPEHIDRLAAYRGSFSALSAALGNVVDAIANLARAAVTIALLVNLHPALVLLPLFALPSLITAQRAERIRQTANLDGIADTRHCDHLFAMSTEPAPVKETKVFGLIGAFAARHAARWNLATGKQQRAQTKANIITVLGWTVFALGYIGSLALLVVGAGAGDATPGDVLLGVVLVGQINGQVATGAQLVGGLTQASAAVEHRRWLLDYASTAHTTPGSAPPPDRIDHGIDFDHVTFQYPGTDQTVVHDINLHLPAGTVVAVVGENGAGKTTLVKLLAGLHQPTAGRIAVDGHDISDFDPDLWRERTTAGFQDFARFQFLAAETVGVGDLPRVNDHATIRSAVERAGASTILDEFPDGIDTQLGVLFGGIEPSGGQWQKLALGRTMMRSDPTLIILDEPTSALDAPSEHALFERYAHTARAAAERTGAITLLVSHRFSTVSAADMIVVLEAGAITQIGTHDELLNDHSGLYADLYTVQARAYE